MSLVCSNCAKNLLILMTLNLMPQPSWPNYIWLKCWHDLSSCRYNQLVLLCIWTFLPPIATYNCVNWPDWKNSISWDWKKPIFDYQFSFGYQSYIDLQQFLTKGIWTYDQSFAISMTNPLVNKRNCFRLPNASNLWGTRFWHESQFSGWFFYYYRLAAFCLQFVISVKPSRWLI